MYVHASGLVDLTIHLSNEIILLLELVDQPGRLSLWTCILKSDLFPYIWGFKIIGSRNDQVLFIGDSYTDVPEN